MHRLLLGTFILISLITLCYTNEDPREKYGRQGRQFVTKFNPSSFYRQNEYKFCLFENKTLPCLSNDICKANGGDFISYCGNDMTDVCCHVVKTCSSYVSTTHGLMFQNPSFPESQDDARFCTLDLKIQRGVCALRIDFSIFELALFEKDFCPSDSFVILGTKSVVAPMCGNLTGFSTTLEVTDTDMLQMAFSVQGTVPYRFSIEMVMLSCADIVPFISPLQAGKLNSDAKPYIPPVVLAAILAALREKADSNSTESSDMSSTTDASTGTATESMEDDTTEATVKREKPYEVVIKAPMVHGGAFEKSIVTDAMNVVPKSSIFQKIFDQKAGQQSCGIYDEPVDVISIARSEPLISVDEFTDPSCWTYNTDSGHYAYVQGCQPEVDLPLDEPSFRVIKGSFANLNEYPWQVAIIYNKTFVCGGSLITNRHVLTAAHCVHGGFKKGMDYLYVSLGDHDLATKNDTNNTVRHVKRIIINLHYFPVAVTNDIAIIELMEPVAYSASIRPVRIPVDNNEQYENQTATVTGWGRFSIKSRKTSPILKEFTSTVADIDKCVKVWQIVKKISAIKEMHICLNISKGTPCHGDSGGPLISCNNDHCSVIGIVSFAFPLCKNIGLPAVFTRVTHFKRWIDISTTPIFYAQRFSKDVRLNN